MHVQCSAASLLFHFIAISKHCITQYFAVFPLFYSVEYGGKDSCNSLSHPHELLRSTSGGDGDSPVSVCVSPGARCSTSSESPTSAANSPSAESTETPSQASNAIMTSNWLGLSGTSMFQGYVLFVSIFVISDTSENVKLKHYNNLYTLLLLVKISAFG